MIEPAKRTKEWLGNRLAKEKEEWVKAIGNVPLGVAFQCH